MLTLQTLCVTLACIPYSWIPDLYYYGEDLLVSVDCCTQLMICYLCCTMGASAQLRKFNCLLVTDVTGAVEI